MDHDFKMHDVPKAAWCEALNDPALHQVIGKLYGRAKVSDSGGGDLMGFCCLGVFARCQGATFEFERVIEHRDDGDVEVENDEATVRSPLDPLKDLNSSELLDQDWADTFGLTVEHQSFLSHLNDGGETVVDRDDPFFPLYQKYCESEGSPRYTTDITPTDRRLFKMRKHSFAEIRSVILEEF